jgi:large subunit ribosomal protein L13
MMIVNGENSVLGRMLTQIAKKALLGEKVDIINCEKIIVSGKKDVVFAKYKRLSDMGVPNKGPFISSAPEMFLKRIARGMLPYKQEKGRTALQRIKFYRGVPPQFEGKETVQFGKSELKVNYISIKEICKYIGGNK